MRLTDITIRSLKIPEKGAVIFHDDVIPGFGVRLSRGGTKSFILTHGPRRQRETLGRVGVISLQDARAEARRRLAGYTLGKERPRAIIWNDAVEEFLAELEPKRRPSTVLSYKYALGKHFCYGPTKLCELQPHDIHQNLARLTNRPSEQQHAYVSLRAFMRWAFRKHYVDRNPMERMQSPHPYVPRERVLDDQELKVVWNAAGDDTFGRIMKTMILTGQRVGEVTQLTGAMVSEDTITIPRWLAKNGREHRIPLGQTARSIMNLPRPKEALIFTTFDGVGRFRSLSKPKRRLDEISGVTEWRLHDLRRTFASGMASIGVAMPVTERLLNHISGSFGGIVGVYQRYNFMPEMREAIALWEAHVAKLVREEEPQLSLPLARTPRLLTHLAAVT